MTTESTDLARRAGLTAAEMRQMIELSRDGKFGFQDLHPAVLNAVYLLCRDLHLIPGEEVIGYQGKPYINARGVLTLARRHPEYRGFSQRPLTLEEKELWSYEPDDIVIATTIRTATWGDIEQHGKVAQQEIGGALSRAQQDKKRPAPVGTAPVELAMKRSLMRTAQAAFGYDAVPTEEVALEGKYDIRQLEHARNVAEYDRVFIEPEQEMEQARAAVE